MPQKLNVFFAFFPYGGNGGISNEHPSIRAWFSKTLLAMKADKRIGEISTQDFSDTPITMTRNKSVEVAKAHEADLLVMVDSDQHPDLYVGQDPLAKPFWNSSFDFLMSRWQKQLTVIGAPYCGPPPHENVYVFKWGTHESDNPNVDMRIEQYTREEATTLAGIHPVAALPTGLIMFDMRVFDIIEPAYFYYEYTDQYEQEKASTEDVTCTRDISLIGAEKLGYSPVFANFDAWAGHYKPKCVGKPKLLTVEQINDKYREAFKSGRTVKERKIYVHGGGR